MTNSSPSYLLSSPTATMNQRPSFGFLAMTSSLPPNSPPPTNPHSRMTQAEQRRRLAELIQEALLIVEEDRDHDC